MKPREKGEWRPSRGGPWPVVQTGGELAPGEREWLHTNGAGAYSMSTVPLLHTRRYHGAFVAALEPPLGRHVILGHADTSVTVEDDRRTYRLATHQFPNVAPTLGYRLLEYFALDPIPRWTFRLGQYTLERTFCLARGTNAAVLGYTWYGKTPARLALRPLMPLRPIEALTKEHGGMMQVVTLRPGAVELRPIPGLPPVHFAHEGFFMGSPDWWRKFEYLGDRAEGLAFQEDIWTPGTFEITLEPGKTSFLVCSVGTPLGRAPADVLAETTEFLRSQDLGAQRSPAVRVLGVAAEHFCLDALDPPVLTAGYPAHALHVRDVLVALPGLLLAREQTQRAKRMLAAVLRHQRFGFLPDVIVAPGAPRAKPCPDATLWLFEVARLLLARTEPRDPFMERTLYPALVRAFLRFSSKTRRWAYRGPDGLLVTDATGVALTWMDATIGGRPVTPRSGAAVEHQALFARACDTLATLASFYGYPRLAARATQTANQCRNAFRARFWCSDTEYPYDCVSEARDRADAWSDSTVRPNALIALAVDPTLFENWQAESLLQKVQSELLTLSGVRSLSPNDRRYLGHFGGSVEEREAAYHQGTAWTHLLGYYARAARQHWGDEPEGREELVKLLERVVDSGPLFGQLAQLSDGDEPFRPRGCPAQATAVAEVLRALVDLGG
jgi:predicted glycogen debranching enzyme